MSGLASTSGASSANSTFGSAASWQEYVSKMWLGQVADTLHVSESRLESLAPVFALVTGSENPATLLLGQTPSSQNVTEERVDNIYSGISSLLSAWNTSSGGDLANFIGLSN